MPGLATYTDDNDTTGTKGHFCPHMRLPECKTEIRRRASPPKLRGPLAVHEEDREVLIPEANREAQSARGVAASHVVAEGKDSWRY
jgi:hypothetical protein